MRSEAVYEVIAGSRAYDLALETSDIDLCRLWDGAYTRSMAGRYNLIRVPRKEFPALAGRAVDHAYLQWWFPAKFRAEGPLTDYIKEERETFIRANLPHIYAVLYDRARGLCAYAKELYPAHPKRLAYSTLFYAILARYAEGRSFAEAHRMDGEVRARLLAMRRKELPLEEALAVNRAWKEKADQAAGFYDKPTDEPYLIEVERNLRALLGLK